jgi:hypothetical protein
MGSSFIMSLIKRIKFILKGGKRVRTENLRRLSAMEEDLKKQDIALPGSSLRILFGPAFSIYEPCFLHDRILSYALRIRGAEIIPTYCDSVQSTECNVYGGVWLEGNNFPDLCASCSNSSEKLWDSSPQPAIRLSEHMEPGDLETVQATVNRILPDSWHNFEVDGLPVGLWAKDILVNNYVVGDYTLIPDHQRLGLAHLRNLLLLKLAYERLLDVVKPDRVVSNDSYYGMWAMLQKLCENRSIPFFSHWIGGRQGGWCYAYNDSAMNLDFSRPWKKFSAIPLDQEKRGKVDNWLEGRLSGAEMILDTASLASHQSERFDLSRLDPEKPIALLAANVIWDLAALNKQVVFEDMIGWIAETIEWFRINPQYQLIIKAHPGELNPLIPETRERIEAALAARKITLPDNVFLLSPRVKLTVYQLYPLVSALLVHTTTVGIEMAAKGMPVITSAKSPYRGFEFTLDPEDRTQYFQALENSLSNRDQIDPELQMDLARRFILFYHFHYYMKMDIMDYRWSEVPRLKVGSIRDIAPGRNIYLDYVADSIMDGQPILGETRWPPES